jgi:tetratricopeptide (TPR) repeat protein
MVHVQTVIVGYGRYLVMLVWPFGLTMRYPRDLSANLPMIALCGLAILFLSSAALWLGRRGARYVPVGWFWFLGMIVPASGIVLVGEQSVADRYTYLSYTGLFIVLSWGAAATLGRRTAWAAIPLLIVCAVLSFRQARTWHDNLALYRHAAEVMPMNFMAHSNLGKFLDDQGKKEEAEAEYRKSLQIELRDFRANTFLGEREHERGDDRRAVEYYRAALAVKPDFAYAHHKLSIALVSLGQNTLAEQECRLALQYDPEFAEAQHNLGFALASRKQWAEALPHYRRAAELMPNCAPAHRHLGQALFELGLREEAMAECKKAIELNPDDIEARHELEKWSNSHGTAH